MAIPFPRATSIIARFRRTREGTAAVEFALILPVMIVLFFGVVEVSMALSCRSDVINVASTTADLTAQASTMSSADVTNVFNAASAILYPYNASAAKITVTSIAYDPDTASMTAGKVAWSCASSGSGYSKGTTISLPDGLMTDNGSVIMAEVTYDYTSPTTLTMGTSMTMQNTFYAKPRRVAQITGPGSCPS
jgi:Flp pilus assembly protein TadG